MNKFNILALVMIIHYGCKNTHNEKAAITSNKKDKSITIQTSVDLNKAPYVDILEKFFNSDDYFVSLSFKEATQTDNIFNLLQKTTSDTACSNEHELRLKLNEIYAQKYLLTDNLRELIVFDSNQNIIDTILLKSFEYYDTTIESFYSVI